MAIGYTPAMFRTKATALIFSLALSSTLLFGSPVHALVHHEHGDHHQQGESLTWQELHNSLRHEDKSVLPATDPFVLISMVLVAVVIFSVRENTTVDSIKDHVRRGIAPHRKFG